jgi:hypothetical protein
MKVRNNKEALEALKNLLADFEMLSDGSWVPESKSINASIEVSKALIDYIKNNDK